MSELLKKYESIDQSKLNEATVKILNRVKTITADFTADDEKNNKIAEQVLNEVMKKNPDSVKIVKRTPKAKATPKKTHKATHTPKVKQTTSSTAKSSNNIMSVAKEIQKAGESWKEAMERAKQVLKERKEQVVQKQKTELEKLFALVKTKKELQGFANSDIQRDSVRDAKPRGARVVTKQGSTSNQYGTFSNKLGRKYWETRDRHADRLAPNYPKNMPLLASGGAVSDAPFSVEVFKTKLRFDNELTSSSKGDFPTFAKAKEFAIDMIDNGNYYAYIFSKNGYLWGVDSKGVEQFSDGGSTEQVSVYGVNGIYYLKTKYGTVGQGYKTKKEAQRIADLVNTGKYKMTNWGAEPVYANGGDLDGEFEVATFSSEEAQSEVIEGGLTYKEAYKLANELWNSGEEYGVEIINSDSNAIDPIVWIKSKGNYANGGSVNMNKHIGEGWTVRDFIEELEPTFNLIMSGRSWQKPFKTKDEVKAWTMDNQPYYKKNIPDVVNYFWAKVQSKDNYADGGGIDGGMNNLTIQNVSFAKGGSIKEVSKISDFMKYLSSISNDNAKTSNRDVNKISEFMKFLSSISNENKELKSLTLKIQDDLRGVIKSLNSKEKISKEEISSIQDDLRDVIKSTESGSFADGGSVKKVPAYAKKRLEQLREEIREERISTGEIAELESLKKYIDPSDVELLQWAGVPEFEEDDDNYAKGGEFALYKIQQKFKYALQPKWEDEKFQTGGRKFLTFAQAQDFKKKLQGLSSSMEYKVVKVGEDEKLANGGSLPFMTDPNFGNFQNTGAFAKGGSVKKVPAYAKRRLEELRKQIREERISTGEIAELESLKQYIDPSDLLLLQWAGVPEFEEEEEEYTDFSQYDTIAYNLSEEDAVKLANEQSEKDPNSQIVLAFTGNGFNVYVKKDSYELGGAFMMTDLAGHTGGSDGLGNPMPLSGVSGTYYTGLVGETGAMSSGELFMDGGAMAQNQQVINDASQSYVNYYLGEGASQGIYKDGGSIPDNYEGRTPEDVWDNWTQKQKLHFLSDHLVLSGKIEDFRASLYRYNELPKDLLSKIETKLTKHINEGQYASGGSLGEELMGGQSNATLKPSGYHLVSAKGREIIVSDDGGNSKERWVKNNGFSGYRLVYKGNDYEFTDSFENGGFTPDVSDGTQFMSGAYAYGGRTKSTPSMRKLYIEQIAFATNTRAVGVDDFAKEHNLTDAELSNLMTGIGRKMISQSDFVTALVGNKNNPKQKEVVAFAKSDKAYKMADGGDVLPPSKTYGENIYKAMQKFNISDSEARKKYGQYTISQWEDLLSEKMADGGGIRSQEELNKIISEKDEKVKGLTPKQVAEMWNENSFGVKEGISKPITVEEAKNPTMKMYLRNLLIENELTEDEYSEYFAKGGTLKKYIDNEDINYVALMIKGSRRIVKEAMF